MTTHTCHAYGCNISVEPRLFMCSRHWFMVPARLRREIRRTYRLGQEITKDPSPEYLVAALAARQHVLGLRLV